MRSQSSGVRARLRSRNVALRMRAAWDVAIFTVPLSGIHFAWMAMLSHSDWVRRKLFMNYNSGEVWRFLSKKALKMKIVLAVGWG